MELGWDGGWGRGGDHGIHHWPVARPNEAVVCLPNGTWTPSVTQDHGTLKPTLFTLPAPDSPLSLPTADIAGSEGYLPDLAEHVFVGLL